MGSSESIEHFVRLYGDLIFDLCESALSDSDYSRIAFRSILKKIQSGSRYQKYTNYERSWVLKITCDRLLSISQHYGHQTTSQEQMNLEETGNSSHRLKQFNHYFHRLLPEDQILLLLKDKYGIPYPEISSAMSIPEGSLKIRRQQALRSLEEWLWNGK